MVTLGGGDYLHQGNVAMWHFEPLEDVLAYMHSPHTAIGWFTASLPVTPLQQ